MDYYAANRAFQAPYLPAAKAIISQYLIVESSLEEDRNEATDLVVFLARAMKIACRVRNTSFAHFSNQFTIRSKLPSGATTELKKICKGFGDWMFYGFADGATNINPWLLIDLRALRFAFLTPKWNALLFKPDGVATGTIVNPDGTEGRWFDIRHLPADVVIAKFPAEVIARRRHQPTATAAEVAAIFDKPAVDIFS